MLAPSFLNTQRHTVNRQTYCNRSQEWVIGGEEVWTRLRYGEIEISNCIDLADWTSAPVVPMVCETCGEAHCFGWNAHVVRTETQLLWMPAFNGTSMHAVEDQHYYSINEAFLIDFDDWEATQEYQRNMPPFGSFPVITNHDLYHLWLQHRPKFALPDAYHTWDQHLQQQCVASHPYDLDEARAIVAVLESVLDSPPVEQQGSFQRVKVDAESFNTFYFEGEGTPEFPAFSTDKPHRLLIDGEYIFA